MNKAIKYPLLYSLYLLAVWTAYRLSSISISQEIDEFLVKPVVWLLPIFLIVRKERDWLKSLGATRERLFPGIYLAVVLGFIFAVETILVSLIKSGNLNIITNQKPLSYSLFIAVGTAVSEEIAFRGYLFNRFLGFFKHELWANLITSSLWLIIHIPAAVALLGYGLTDAVSFLSLAFIYSIGACFVFARTKNIFSSVFLFIIWEASIILFR